MGVAVSNFFTASIQFGKEISDKLNIEPLDFFIPIIQQTTQNCINSLTNKETNLNISGPIVRNDEKTIQKHIEALENYPELKNIYINFTSIIQKNDKRLMQKQ